MAAASVTEIHRWFRGDFRTKNVCSYNVNMHSRYAIAIVMAISLIAGCKDRNTASGLSPSNQSRAFRIKALPCVDGLNYRAYAINDQGLIAGAMSKVQEDPLLPCAWIDNKAVAIKLENGQKGVAYAVSGNGQIGGIVWDDRNIEHGFVTDSILGKGISIEPSNSTICATGPDSTFYGSIRNQPNQDVMCRFESGKVCRYPTLSYSSEIHGANASGSVVGSYLSKPHSMPTAFAVLSGKTISIGGFGKSSSGQAINLHNQIVGHSMTRAGTWHAFLWQKGKVRDLGTLGGTNSWAYDINDSGTIVGYSQVKGDKAIHAFVWQDGAMKDLGTLGGNNSYAEAINNDGTIVGASDLPGNKQTVAFIGRFANTAAK